MTLGLAPLELAGELGHRLARAALWHDGACTFVTESTEPRGASFVRSKTCGASLYDGTAGVARFLGHLGAVTGETAWIEVARGCLAHALAQAPRIGPGLYDGLGGVCAVAVELGLVFEDARLVERGREAAHLALGRDDPASGEWDLLAGTAGLIVMAATIGNVTGDRELAEAAVRIGEVWLRRARRRAEGLSWGSAEYAAVERDDLCGLAHGAAGAALALETLGALTGDSRWRTAADDTRRYERSGFDPSSSGWADLRAESTTDLGQHFWCHGAAGVGAERLAALAHRRDPELLSEASAAVHGLSGWCNALLSGPVGTGGPFEANLSVCHGLGGATDVLSTAAALSGESRLRSVGAGYTRFARDALSSGRVPCGLLNAGELPGLMMGISGIGSVLLRVHDPASMPPVTLPPLAARVLASVRT